MTTPIRTALIFGMIIGFILGATLSCVPMTVDEPATCKAKYVVCDVAQRGSR